MFRPDKFSMMPNIGMGLPPPQPVARQNAPIQAPTKQPRQFNINPTVKSLLFNQFPKLESLQLSQPGTKQIPMSAFSNAMPGVFGMTSRGRMK